jgi:hypothetical protein
LLPAARVLRAADKRTFAMLDFAWGFLARGAVMIPTAILTSAALWWLAHKYGYAKSGVGFEARDIRTWPFRFAMGEAAIFGVIIAATTAALGDGALANGISGGAAALITLGIIPALMPSLKK